MPLPKKKLSRARAGKRRSHLGLTPPAMVECNHCHKMKPPHKVCPNCGYYSGRRVVEVEEK